MLLVLIKSTGIVVIVVLLLVLIKCTGIVVIVIVIVIFVLLLVLTGSRDWLQKLG